MHNKKKKSWLLLHTIFLEFVKLYKKTDVLFFLFLKELLTLY